jgi:predicted nucleotidyltransferase
MLPDLLIPEDLRNDIFVAAEILLRNGCREIYVFGSIAKGTSTSESDIDLAIVGLPKDRFFAAYGRILSKVRRGVDLVALDYDQAFAERLREAGSLTRVA